MNEPFNPKTMLRSPREKLGWYIILPRLIDKVRLHQRGLLPADYVPNLLKMPNLETGSFPFDGRFLFFTGLDPEALRTAILSTPDDQTVLQWVNQNAKVHTDLEKEQWSDSTVKEFSTPNPERIALRTHFYPKVAELVGSEILGSLNPFDMVDFDENRISLEDLLARNQDGRDR